MKETINVPQQTFKHSLKRTLNLEIVDALFYCIELRDKLTATHSVVMAHYSYELAKIYDQEQSLLYYAGSLIHDIGKIAMDDRILKGNIRLSADERTCLWEHVKSGERILERLPLPAIVKDIVRYHHERFDGSGYIKGLKGYSIPLCGRIAAVSDTFSAIICGRPYQNLRSAREAINIMKRDTHLFDAAILKSLTIIVEKEINNNRVISESKVPWNMLQDTEKIK
ncbi:HD-GYP domain-containing protein [Paenibacillus lautus]|uniref:HD-GYP domain-containing protein n=1 Tax=Paenibacillus lautus TaxID=1401 RepID=UPI001C7D5A50|nr:HD domain-containing phosphohydrolase [Paenibacillus lautus]MBX4152593.1 HD domain-containing protein [Paenibacillus lautus]